MSNKLGWLVAVILVLVVSGLIIYIQFRVPPPDPPTSATTAEGVLEMHKVALPLATVVGQDPSQSGSAMEMYVRAIDRFAQDRESIYNASGRAEQVDDEIRKRVHSSYGRALEVSMNLDAAALASLEEVHDLVAQGAARTEPELLSAVDVDKLMVANPTRVPVQDEFTELYSAEQILSLYYLTRRQFDKARQVLQDTFMLGYHVNRSRARGPLSRLGMQIQYFALNNLYLLAKLEEQSDRGDELSQYHKALNKVHDHTIRKLQLVRTANVEAGDVFNIIENDDDRMWRVEGLLLLGPLKFRYEKIERNRIKIDQLIEEYKGHGDPLLKAAARTADKFDRDDAIDFGIAF
jgi:hypothetical protein